MPYHLKEPQSTQCLVSDKEVAKLLGCSTRHIFSLRHRGELPFVRVGQLVRFKLEDVQNYVNRQTINKVPLDV